MAYRWSEARPPGAHAAAARRGSRPPPCRSAQAAPPGTYLVSQLNRDVPPAAAGELQPLRLGAGLSVWPPVLLAPMAGLTSLPLRQICGEAGAPLCTSEMIIASTLVQQNRWAARGRGARLVPRRLYAAALRTSCRRSGSRLSG